MFGGTTAVLSGALIFLVTISALTSGSSFDAGVFSALLAATFAMVWIGNIRQRRRSVRLLAHGRVGYATLAAKTELVGSRHSKLYALRFTFDDDGVERGIELRTQRPKLL